MPLTWDQATFDAAYQISIRDPEAPDYGAVVGYGKRFAQRCGPGRYDDIPWYYVRRAGWLIMRLENLGLNENHRVLIVGGGFGYLNYAFRHIADYPAVTQQIFPNHTFTNHPLTWQVDNSAWIESNWDAERLGDEDVVWDDILNISKQQLRAKLVQLTGDWQFHVIITENVLESYSAEENALLLQLALACEVALIGDDHRRIIHIVNAISSYPPRPVTVPLRQMLLSEWAALRPAHTWIDGETGEVIYGVS